MSLASTSGCWGSAASWSKPCGSGSLQTKPFFFFFLTEEAKSWTAKCWNYREEYSWKATAMKDEAFVFPVVTLIRVNTFCKKKMAQWLKNQEKHFWRGCSLMTPRPNTTATLKPLCVLKGTLKRCCLFAWWDGQVLLNLGKIPYPDPSTTIFLPQTRTLDIED